MIENRKVVAAAIKTGDGVIHFMPSPHRHHHTIHALHMQQNENDHGLIIAHGEQGFVISDGTFMGRKDAGELAIKSGQIKSLNWPPDLYSEDLW